MYSIFRIHLDHLPLQERIVFDFSHTFGAFARAGAHCIRFFEYNWAIYPCRSALYSIFRIHLARLPTQEHIVFDFSNTFGPFAYAGAHCIRFFEYNWAIYPCRSTLYSIFRIHLDRLPAHERIVFDFSHTFGPFAQNSGSYFYRYHCFRQIHASLRKIHSWVVS